MWGCVRCFCERLDMRSGNAMRWFGVVPEEKRSVLYYAPPWDFHLVPAWLAYGFAFTGLGAFVRAPDPLQLQPLHGSRRGNQLLRRLLVVKMSWLREMTRSTRFLFLDPVMLLQSQLGSGPLFWDFCGGCCRVGSFRVLVPWRPWCL